jgi:hypothetical protein
MCCTRPDLALPVGFLALFMSNPSPVHWAALKRILRYIKGTSNLGLCFKPAQSTNQKPKLTAYSDSGWASAHDRRSITGYLILFNETPIIWKSQRQPCIAMSSTEAEIIAASAASQDLIWIQRVLQDLSTSAIEPTNLLIDNEGAEALERDNKINKRTKHIDLRHLFIRDQLSKGLLTVQHVSTKENVADTFTKPLSFPLFSHHRNLLQLKTPENYAN